MLPVGLDGEDQAAAALPAMAVGAAVAQEVRGLPPVCSKAFTNM
jgi:hypothetical protein